MFSDSINQICRQVEKVSSATEEVNDSIKTYDEAAKPAKSSSKGK